MNTFKNNKTAQLFLKCISITVSVIIAFSAFAVGIVSARAEDQIDVWNGTKSQSFAGGTGTAADPYLIETAEQLAYVVSTDLQDGLCFKLISDIRINDTTKENWKSTAREWVWADIRFVGTFDGDGHTIDGLYFNTNQWKRGLFSYIGDTVIKNLIFTNASVNTTYSGDGGSGIVAGQLSAPATFQRIYIDETCEINAPNANGVAAIASWGGYAATIDNCAVLTDKIVGKGYLGAIIGTNWSNKSIVTNCFTASSLPIRGYGSIVNPSNNYALVSDNIGTTVLESAEQMKGENARIYMSGLDFNNMWQITDNGYPILSSDFIEKWDGTVASSFAGGSGTESDPYLIENGGQLYKMVKEYSDTSISAKPASHTYFKITKDIDLGNNQWYTTGSTAYPNNTNYNKGFSGIIYGEGHTIKGLYNGKAAATVGLIPIATQGAEIYDLHLAGGYFPKAAWNVYAGGAFIGLAVGVSNSAPVVIRGCSVKDFTIENRDASAAFVGFLYSQSVGIYNSYCVDSKISHTAQSASNTGAFIAVASGNDYLNSITVANSYCVDVAPTIKTNNSMNKIVTIENVYTQYPDYDGSVAGITKLSDDQMKGENARQYMKGFDFDTSWTAVGDGYPIHYIYVKPDYIWKGETAEEFADGSGTPNDPYLIENGAQLYKMVKEYSNASGASGAENKATYFKLINDIYLNDVRENDLINASAASWNAKFNSWYSVSSYSKGFCGDLDGNGYTVYGLYSNTGYSGLIPVLLDGGSVHNLNLKNSYITGWESGGGIVGFVKAHWKMSPVSVSYCTVDNVVVESSKRFVGGIIGGFGDLKITVSDCSVTRTRLISTNENANLVSGLIGNGWGNLVQKVSNCYTDSSVHPISATADRESFDTVLGYVSYTNVYTSAEKNFDADGITYLANDSLLKGDSVSEILKGFDFTNDWCEAENDYPVIRNNAGSWMYDTKLSGEVWSGKVSRFYASGDGSEQDPYVIETGGQLALLANDALNGKTANKHYKITEDIILNNTSSDNWKKTANEWYTGAWAQAFRGHLDGGYHTVSGLYLDKNSNNYTGTDYYSGLFACIGREAVIEKLGIVNSSIVFTDNISQRYVGAFAGFVDQYDAAAASFDEYPIIRECFADTSVFLDSVSCGGMIGCATRPIRIENSFFTGKVKSTSRGLFGYSKMNSNYDDILVRHFYTADSDYAVLSNPSYDNFKIKSCYSSSAQDKDGLTRLFIDKMCGKAAKDNMTEFDFNNIWVTRGESETPGLKGFNADAYSNHMSPSDIVVSFETNCGLAVKSITGKAYSKLDLPVLSREGYVFDGWYAYPELDVPFDYDYFPTFNTILYAKWTLLGFMQDFEQYEDSEYDYHEDYEYYRPTTPEYSAKCVHGGAKSMHRIGDSDEALDFLLFYEEELEIGKKYKMVFYTTTDQNNASVDVSLVHLDWPDVYSADNGVQKIAAIRDLKNGEWQELSFTFVARSKWIAIRTSGGNSVYFDDFVLYNTDGAANTAVILPTGSNSVSPDYSGDSPSEAQPNDPVTNPSENDKVISETEKGSSQKQTPKDPNYLWIIILAAGISVIAVGTVIVICVIKKRKK